MFKVLDAYSLKARLFPALLAIIPSLAALAILVSWSKFGLTSVVATTAIPVLVFAAADVARRLGKRAENTIYLQLGGKPSITMLRYSDNTFGAQTKAKYRQFLSSRTNEHAPTEQEESNNPKVADEFYESCGNWLRENTRNTTKFHVLFSENITYGFRRNLLGLKWPALYLNAAMILLCLFLLDLKGPIDIEDDITTRLVMVLALAVIHSIFMAFAVSKGSAIEASRSYARQLLLSCETFIGKEKPANPSISKSSGKKKHTDDHNSR